MARKIVSFLLLVGLVIGSAWFLGNAGPKIALAVTLCICGAVVAFLRTEMAIYFLIAAMLLSPQIDIGGKQLMTRSRGITLRLDDLFILIISAAWFLKNAFYKELGLIPRTPLNGAIWTYTSACLLSTLIGMLGPGNVEPRSGALFVFKYIEYFVIFWMVVNTTHSEQQIRRYLVLMLAVALVVSAVGIFQAPSGARVVAPFEGEKGEPNTFGGYLLLMFSVIMGLVSCSKEHRKTLILIGAVVLITFFYTLSRASYVGLIPVVFLLPWLTRRKALMVVVVIAALLVLAFPTILLPRATLDRVLYTFSQGPQSGQVVIKGRRLDLSTSARYYNYIAAVDAFIERPLIGWGVTGWHFVDSQYFRTLVETGIIGLASFFYLIYKIVQMAFKTRARFYKKNQFYFGLSSGFIVGTVGLLAHAIGSNTFIIVRIMEPYWMLCAMVIILPEVVPESVPTTNDSVSASTWDGLPETGSIPRDMQ
jgi:O-antigen ligase